MAQDDAPQCDFVILAVQDREFEAILDLADHVKEEPSRAGTLYRVRVTPPGSPEMPGLDGVVARMGGAGRVEAALTGSRLLQLMTPQALLLVGIAGGFPSNGVVLGDLIVASRIIDYEEQRLGENERAFRLKCFEADEVLLQASKAAAGGNWSQRLPYPPGDRPHLHFGSVLSGDKVVASADFVADLLAQEPSALGVEMEGAGVAAAVAREDHLVRFLMIRGVVDLANEQKREDSRAWLERTCDAVASFALATLFKMQADNGLTGPR
jgi:nucleoside phosphorylase